MSRVAVPPLPLDESDDDIERRLISQYTKNPDGFYKIFLDIICNPATSSQGRLQSANFLRHLLRCMPKIWPRLNSDLQSRLKNDLLNFLNANVKEETRSILGYFRGAVIEIGSNLLPNDSWPELVSYIFRAEASTSHQVRRSALFIFSHLAHLIKWQFILPRLDSLHSFIRSSLIIESSDRDAPYERNTALLAAITLIDIVPPDDLHYQMLQDLLPDMISVLLQAFTRNQQEFATEAVIMLTDLIADKPKFISPCLSEVLEAMFHIAEFDKVNKDLRCEAVNLVVTLAQEEPVMVEQKLVVPFLGRLVAILLEMLSDMEEDEDEDTGDLDAKKLSSALSAALGRDLLVPVLLKLLPGYLRDSDWKKRHGALLFLKEIAKGCVEVLKENLEQIVKMMVASFKDKHPTVKVAALITMHKLLVDLKPDLEDQYHERIFPTLLRAMRFDRPNIQVEAARAAWDFMRWCSEDILKIYLNKFFETLYTMIQTGDRVVQDNALLILGLLATFLKEHMHLLYGYNVESIYKNIMPKLKCFLKAEISKADRDRRLCANSAQCIYYIGTGLGKGHFRNDAKEVMEEMMSFKGAKMKACDPATGSLLITWTRLLECLGRDFLPYMELVMPPMLQYAQSDSELIVSSSNMDNTEIKSGEGAGEKLLDEKATACNMLCCYADELKEDFYPWIDQVARLLLPFLKIKFHKNVRKTAISAMSKLLCSAKLAVEKEKPCVAVKLLCAISNSLIEAMHEEDDKELCCEMVKSMVDCISAIKILKKAT